MNTDRIISDDELKADGELLLTFTIPSNPATKKNSNRLVKVHGFTKVLPSERFMKYQTFCKPFIEEVQKKFNITNPIDFGISISVKVYCVNWRLPDITNIYQALGDILQHHNLITNDKWIHWSDNFQGTPQHWFGGVDKENPRIEIEIKRYRHKLEDFYNKKGNKKVK